MAKSDLTKEIEFALLTKYLNKGGRSGVEIGCPTGQVDFVHLERKYINRKQEIISTCYEIKISKSDFKSKHGHNFIGNFNYYVVPKELYDKLNDEDYNWRDRTDIGVIVYYPNSKTLRIARKSTIRDAASSIYTIDNCNTSLVWHMLLAWQTGSMQKILVKHGLSLPNDIKFCKLCGKEVLNLYNDTWYDKTESTKYMCYDCYKENKKWR